MSTIVITGARGYIGSALANRLAGEGHTLRLVSRAPDAPRVVPSGALIDNLVADLRDEASWATLLDGADAVVHLSSRTDLRAAEADPVGDENINVEPMRALVRAAEKAATRPIVAFASTVTIVGINPRIPVDEQTPDDPTSVYDRHKLACERILREATARGVLRAASLRLSNVYGYGTVSINSNRGILNAMMRRAANGEALSVYGDGAYVRDFTHLQDVVDAFCHVIAAPAACDGSHYVIATGAGHSLAEAFALVTAEAERQTGCKIALHHVPEPADLRPIERRNFVGNARLLRERTGWRPRFDLKAGIRDYFARALALPVAVQ
ncbi:MAG TPA: NAD(P)-dependent oxidoreductase [Pseudolabrys sp.]|nr:NAD(P)-dependent oxidoreductase [Pseudolabrys sp.]